MKSNLYKTNPKRILGYLMAFAMIFFNFSVVNAQITNVGNTFSPDTLTVTVGTSISFSLGSSHNAVEVDQATWISNGNTSNGGFSTPYGGGTVTPTIAQTYYYVCAPHASGGMKGVIIATAAPCNMTASTSATDETWLGACDGTVSAFASNSVCYTGSPILITEYDPGAPDVLEIQNISGGPVDVTGWRVVVSNVYTTINTANPIEQVLSGTMIANETKWWNDQAGSPNYWGNNLFWNPGVYPSFTGWIMLLDNNDNIMDVFIANWPAAIIATSSITISTGSTVSFAGHWNGDGYDQSLIPTTLSSASRIGNSDNNSASDFSTMSTSAGITNTGLTLPFSGGGGSTFLWSTGDTSQTVTGLCPGTYSVTVTDCVGCTDTASATVSTTYMGCTDPFAANYNPLANVDDGSCLYAGCTDPFALNYSASYNADCDTIAGGNSTTCCIYPQANALDFCDDLESASFSTNGWTTLPGTAAGCYVQLTSANAIADTVSIEMTGADALAGWSGIPTTEAQAFANTSHVSSATILLDLSASTGPVDLAFDYETGSFYSWAGGPFGGSVYSTMRVKVNGVVVSDVNGDSWHGNGTLTNLRYNLSSYAGQSNVSVTFESACRYGPGWSIGTYGDYVWIDNVCAFNVTPCTYYALNTTSTDVTCNAGSDGSISATITGMDTSFTYNNSYSWTDASGSVVGTSSTVSGLAAGTYTCTVSDITNGCSASSSVTVTEPTPIVVTAIIVPSSTPMSNNGSVDVTVSGGTPCATSIQVGSGTTSSYLSYLWYTWYMDGRTQMTYTASELAVLGMTSGDIMDELAWNILLQDGSAATTIMNNAQMTVNGTVVYSGNYQAVLGMNNFVFSTPVVYTGGDIVVEWCFDNAAYVLGNNYFESTITPGTMSQYADLATSSGCGLTALLARTYRPNAYIGFQAASGYTFAWSTGDTTEDVSGLGMGPIAVTVTDCDSCTAVWSAFIIASTSPGCVDPTASNYDPSANADCGSNPISSGSYGDTSCCLYPGCMDSTASNYNPSANVSDSSCIYPGCMSPTAINYNPQANVDDGSCQPCSGLIVLDNQTFSCYGANDGSVTVSALACVIWNWVDNGSTIGNRQNMAPGVYTLVGMTCDSSCIDSLVVTIIEQTAITATMSVGNEYPAGAANGSIDITVSGGTPCVTSADLVCPIPGGNGQSGNAFNIINTSSGSLTITGFSQGPGTGGSANPAAPMVVYSTAGSYLTAPVWTLEGSATVVLTPGAATGYCPVSVVIPAGGTMGFWVGITVGTVQYTNGLGTPGVSVWASDANLTLTEGHGGSAAGQGTQFSPRNWNGTVHYGDPGVTPYAFAWSTGDTTEDISGLSAGQYCVTVTDCNGCSDVFCDSVIVLPILGCTDTLAANYNPLANLDDGSCWYTLLGCTDSTAVNYDPLANTDDGSCCFIAGCIDPFATNYNANACYNDSSCTYPTPNLAPFCENVESGSTATNGWVLGQQTYASVFIQDTSNTFLVNGHPGNNGPITGNYSLRFEGGDAPTGWGAYNTEAARYANTTHVSSATIIMDFSLSAASVEMSFDLGIFSGFSNVGYTSMRVKVGGVVIPDVNGNTSYWNGAAPFTIGAPAQTIVYNMSAYSGQSSVSVTFEFAGKYSTNYSSGLYGNVALVDDICFYDLNACTYHTASATATDVSCHGGNDGSATASSTGGAGLYTCLWDDANAQTTTTATSLSAGTYSCIVTDSAGCVDTAFVTITEPSAVSLSAVTVDPTAAGNDGSIDLSVSGGTPCETGAIVLAGTHFSSYSYAFTRGFWFQAQSSFTMTGLRSPSDNPAAANAAKQSVAILDFGATQPAYVLTLGATGNVGVNHWGAFNVDTGWANIPGGFQVISGNYYCVMGSAHDDPTVSATCYNSYGMAATAVVTLDGMPTQLNRAGMQASMTAYTSATALDNNIWCYSVPGMSQIGRIHMRTGVMGANSYAYAWSTGDTTEDLSNLSAGTYSVTATDCNGCIESGSYTLVSSGVPGCTDTLACNYDPLATIDDGSCIFPDGCTDPLACNYDSTALCDDGSCLTAYGCTDSTAFNYDPLATCDDGSCVTIQYGCTDPNAVNFNPLVNTDDGSCVYYGCTDPAATNYNATAVVGCDASGSTTCCIYSTGCGAITGVYMSDVIHDRATFNWDNMNSSTCNVDQIRIRYREVGTSAYSTKTMGVPVGSGCNTSNTSKRVLNLSASTQYEYDFKIWYCGAATVTWHAGGTFTTAPVCDNVINVTATPTSQTGQANFCWDTVSTYSFVRLKYREDVPGSSFINIGGMGVMSPQLCKTKNNITSGLTYRVMWRTWCSPTGGPYRSAGWDGPTIWTQPVIRLEGGTTINNLDVYPNPSRDIFNVTFTSEDVQDLDVRVLNIVGEVVYTENLEQFVGEYTKAIDLTNNAKGIYFLEITTNNGVVNKKLILQ